MKASTTSAEHKWQLLFSRRRRLILVLLLILFFANALNGAIRNSAVCDELGGHIPCGYLYWSSGEFSGGLSNLPLGQLLIALPVKMLGCSYELFTEQYLVLFRLPVLLMGLLLGGLVYRFASELYSRGVGLAALFLYALSPNILAHTSLATLDLPVTFFIFLMIYLLYRYVQKPGVLRLVLFALALSGAMLIKVQALGLIPVTVLAFIVFLRGKIPAEKRAKRLFLASWLLIPAIIILAANIVYLHLPVSIGGLLPAQFIDAIRGKLLHTGKGHFSYLLGEYSHTGWWYYFPLALLFKTPVPALVFIAAGLLSRHSRQVVVFVIVPIVLFLTAAMNSKINIGLRHLLVIYPFLFLLGGYGITRLWNPLGRRVVLAGLIAGYCAQAVFITPHHLSYFNILTGGPADGHRYLIDSNFDWGQNDHFLRCYIERKQITDCKINPNPFAPTFGHIFVNVNALYGVNNGGPEAYVWLEEFRPTGQVAYTWFEYEIPEEAVSVQPDNQQVNKLFLDYLFYIKERFSGIDNVRFRFRLAALFASFAAYDVAFDELRSILSDDPAFIPALATGGELIVRDKLGVLRYQADEYLTGFHTEKPQDDIRIDEAGIIQLAEMTGYSRLFSLLHTELAFNLLQKGDLQGSIDAFRTAIRFDPENETALSSLGQLGERDE